MLSALSAPLTCWSSCTNKPENVYRGRISHRPAGPNLNQRYYNLFYPLHPATLRTIVHRFILSYKNALMPGHGIVRQVIAWRWHKSEVTVPVLAAYQHREVLLRHHLPDMGRNIVDGKSDPPLIGVVGSGGVQQIAVMERRLPGR